MALRQIRTVGDPCLTKVCKEVEEVNERTLTLIDDMLDTMYEAEGVGLAAPQVGVLKRIVVIDVGEGPIVMINPEILETSGSQTGSEGCLSVPGKAGTVTRPDYVKAKAYDEEMNEYVIEGEELLARAICHELAHLDGHLYTELVEGELVDTEAEEDNKKNKKVDEEYMRVVFMGTPGFAVGTLKALLEAGHDVAAVVTQPDKPKGRGKELLMTPVKAEAVKHDIPVFQPERVRKNEEFLEELKKLAPDVIVVVAFGQLLPVSVLTLPKYGCVNVHASLLPMYRGAAPLQWVIINGEKVSGVTTMQMDKGLDTGDMLLKEEVAIEPKETYETYHDKLSVVGAQLLIKTLDGLEAGTITPVKQEGDTCYASMIDKSLGNLDFTRPAVELERLMRGLDPAPAAYSFLDGKLLKLFGADVVDSDKEYSAQECGIITNITKNTFDITTGAGVLRVNEVQLEGKKRMDAASFLRGCRLTEGTALKNSR